MNINPDKVKELVLFFSELDDDYQKELMSKAYELSLKQSQKNLIKKENKKIKSEEEYKKEIEKRSREINKEILDLLQIFDKIDDEKKAQIVIILDKLSHGNITIKTDIQIKINSKKVSLKDYIEEDDFMLTYGDGVSDVNIQNVLAFHHQHGKIATITTTQPPGRFGALKIDADTNQVRGFKEKARADSAWVNAGFMVLNRKIFDYLGDGSEMLEAGPLEAVAMDGEMMAYKHAGFWSPMDNVRDKEYLEKLWADGRALWKVW